MCALSPRSRSASTLEALQPFSPLPGNRPASLLLGAARQTAQPVTGTFA